MNLLQAAGIDPGEASGWAQVAILLTTVAGFLFQAYRENRNHKWEEQRRKEEASDAEAKRIVIAQKVQEALDVRAKEVEMEAARLALDVKAEVEKRANQIKEESKAHNAGVQAAIQKNTLMNEQALDRANGFNGKLHEMLEQIDKARIDSKEAAADAIIAAAKSAATEVTASRVVRIEEVVKDNNDQIRQAREDLETLNVSKESQKRP